MHEFKLPDVGEGISEGELVEWLVAVGDDVDEGDLVAEVATDKVTVELPAPAAGTISELRVEEGEVVPVGTVILVIDGEETVPPPPPAAAADDGASAAPVTDAAPADVTGVVAAPSTRRVAAEKGVDLAMVSGTGPDGRILLADVEAAAGTPPAPAGEPAPARPAASPDGHRESLQGVRRTMAQQMARSAGTTATSTTTFEVRADRLTQLLDDLRDDDGSRRFSPLPIVLKCVAAALRHHARFNATIEGDADGLVLHDAVDVAVAVATPEGLTVPVVRSVDRRSLADVAADVRALAERARDGALTMDELRGGSFTLSSTGGLERATIISTTPIINLPHVATMWVSRIQPRVRVAEGGGLEDGPMMTCSLSFDHRFIDGAEATAFINDVAELLERPERALL